MGFAKGLYFEIAVKMLQKTRTQGFESFFCLFLDSKAYPHGNVFFFYLPQVFRIRPQNISNDPHGESQAFGEIRVFIVDVAIALVSRA